MTAGGLLRQKGRDRMLLSTRMRTIAHAVTPGKKAADIGTDHAFVPIYLVESGRCPYAIAMDVNPGPLERADAHIRESGLEDKISLRLSDGMRRLRQGEADAVILSGMGGDLICRILREREDLLRSGIELILQPQSEWFKVRHTLHDLGYSIVMEWFLKEEGKYYVVIKSVPGTQSFSLESEYLYGQTVEENCRPVLEEYLDREKKKREEIIRRLSGNSRKKTPLQERRVDELEYEIRLIDEKLDQSRTISRVMS